MNRREFFKKTSIAGLAAYSYVKFGNNNIFAQSENPYDLVAIKGGEPEAMFDKAMQSLGGMKNFVKKNQTVVIKPNIGWNSTPERAANTNPKLVSQIIKHCYEAGAKKVYVFDHTCDSWQSCYDTSMIEKYANDAGATVVTGNSESYYHPVNVPKGKKLKDATVHELILESDVFINVPVLKNHGGAGLTISMKNLMGIVWDRRFWHRNDLHQCIADFATYRKPDLNIVDAYNVMKRNGPRGVSEEDVVTMKSQIISTDIVAADAAAAKLFGKEPAELDYIKYASELGIGKMDLSKLNINRIIL
ncbi:MAG: DUF362 domain-containing protein [Ignavibacteriae bacterium]|nr:DUF362 domain-containing protein [Ignavibacteriota bacterium]MCB9207027.1 DUF362 domain-containing protein [Ignavibacteriales bacterium]MCB9207776.1 DUF362 domain-containing protein [Ignavibacteriales bacterium]MCB9258546.1 DUF362 domain-containing protein [Ignavibacteriales bacterium]